MRRPLLALLTAALIGTGANGIGGSGIALDGRFRPVVEFMYADFLWVAADQLFNQIAKARHMFGGDAVGFHRQVQWIHARSPDRATRGIELDHDLAYAPGIGHGREAMS